MTSLSSSTLLTSRIPTPPPSPFHTLPKELIVRIFQCLTTEDFIHLQLVSKHFRCWIFTSPELWKYTRFQFHPRWHHHEKVCQLIHQQKAFIHVLTLVHVRDDVLRSVLPACTDMKALHFHRWTTLSDHAFLHLPPQLEFTHLHTLSLVDPGGMYTAVGSQGLKVMIQACPNLHHLHLWCNLRVDGNTLLQCVSQCTLTSLSLSSSQWISDQEWINVFAQTPMLKYLNVSHVIQCTDPWFQSFPKSLEVVGIHGGSQLTDAGVFHWRDRCPKLSTVKFWDCPKISLGVMEKLGFTSVHYTPAILHPPCFKVGIGFGFQRHVSHPLSPSFSLSPPLRPSPITPSSTSSLQSKVEETEASPSSTLPASSTTHAASSDSVGQEENISSTSEDEVESEMSTSSTTFTVLIQA